MNYIVRLEKMHFKANHGLYDFEKEKGNDFYLNVDVKLALPSNHVFSGIEATINYERIAEVCKKHMEMTYDLLEQVAHIITLELFQILQFASVIVIEIFKSKPPIPIDCEFSVVKLEMSRSELGR